MSQTLTTVHASRVQFKKSFLLQVRKDALFSFKSLIVLPFNFRPTITLEWICVIDVQYRHPICRKVYPFSIAVEAVVSAINQVSSYT